MSPLTKHNIIISPIGAMDPVIPAKISQAIQQVFGLETETMSLLDNTEFAYNPVRGQYFSTLIIEKLTELAPARAYKILALCEIDLFIPILTYVYGEAQLSGKSCIVSLFRLKNRDSTISTREKAFVKRAIKETIHELGHTFGLRHCTDQACLMHYCRSIDDVDRKSDQFCRYCQIMLDDVIKKPP